MKYQKGEANTYLSRVKEQVDASKAVAEAEGVVVPTTVEDYVIAFKPGTCGPRNLHSFVG